MIRVYAAKRGGKYRLFVSGHAAEGNMRDAICAGVSALAGTLLDFAAATPECHHLRYTEKKGEVFLSCRGGLGKGWDLTMHGLCLIAEQYPESVRIESNICS